MDETKSIFEANLAALSRSDSELAERLRNTPPAQVQWLPLAGGLWSASLITSPTTAPLTIASRFDPIAEASKLIAGVDPAKHAGVVLMGVGLGYHVALIARQTADRLAVLVLYEPDLSLLRAVLEKIDHTAWLGRANVIITDDSNDRAKLLSRLERFAGALTLGTMLVTHPLTRRLHNDKINLFGQMVTDVLAYCRTNVATALVNASRTIRNNSLNIPYYVAGATTEELLGAAKGFPCVCVGAGPSLAKNVDLLRDPRIRESVVIITAQTTLKPLLDRGIRPDFVTALDFHEISKRFYEGLPELPDVTLVAEPKANPAILESFPGPIRVTRSGFLDRLLGNLARPLTPIRDGATVAHLSFYLAQHMGCDPIIMIGQDLGFSDGLYYCPGTAIHDVWAPELGAFNSVEMMEWQRIVRHRNHLQKFNDVHGKPIYSDEQMTTYLKQFERDFTTATQRVIDATEGGMPKEHTKRMTLAEALAEFATRPVVKLPRATRGLDLARLDAVEKLLRQRYDETAELRSVSQRTLPILRDMLAYQKNEGKMQKLFAQLEPLQNRVGQLSATFALVNELNTAGVFRRVRADRAIEHDKEADPFVHQAKQLERDLDNVDWLSQACDETLTIFRDALTRIEVVRKMRNA